MKVILHYSLLYKVILHYLFLQVMGAYGYSIEHILMVDILPDPSVRKAMNEINAGKLYYPLLSHTFQVSNDSYTSRHRMI